MNGSLIDVVNKRYSAKTFDPEKKISDAHVEQLMALLRFSPSSVNSQPWHFIIAGTDEGKKRITRGTQGFYTFNEAKVLNASHVVLFCAKTDIDEEYTLKLLEQEDLDGRFTEPGFKDDNHMGRSIFVNMHRFDLKDAQHWMEKQVYLNMGTLLLGAGALGIDAVPIEGLDPKALDEEFSLREKGYTALAIVALGYHSEEDFNASLPKSRLPEEEIFTILP